MDKKNLAGWVESYTGDLFKWAYFRVSDAELAKDLVQDTFLAAAEMLSTFKEESTPKTWLFSILNHKVIDYYRKRIHQTISIDEKGYSGFFDSEGRWLKSKRPEDWERNEEHLLDNAGFLEVLKKCLDALPGRWGTRVKLKYLLNKNSEEICQELEITPTNFWQIIHRAKLQLRDCVENNWF